MEQTRSITELLLDLESTKADEVYLRQPHKGVWSDYTWKRVMTEARQVAAFLLSLGLKPGAHVSIYSKNCAEWFIADFGITLAGMVNVPLIPNQHRDTLAFILEHAEVELVFLGKLDDYKRARRAVPESIKTIAFQYHPDIPAGYYWDSVLAVEPIKEVVIPKPADLFTIIYTSGTSQLPKGAMFTHGIIAEYLQIFKKDFERVNHIPFNHLISYLPLAHVYERTTVELGSLVMPCEVAFVERLDTFVENLKNVQPTMFTAVPRIWGIFQQRIEQNISPRLLNILLHIPIVASRVRAKIKTQLGLSRTVHNFCGAAHLPVDTIKFFNRLGVKIQEGYGQTENLAYGTFQKIDERIPGYVGSPRYGVDVKLGDEDELWIKSPCIMKGYYKDEEATQKAFSEEGWLRTGDTAELKYGQVKIVGRLADNFKNQKGEFIAPAPIEALFCLNKLIEQCCLVGREQPSNVMLVQLSSAANQLDKVFITDTLKDTLRSTNAKLKSYEKVSRMIIIKDDWTPENNVLTPTLKIKRRIVESKYHDLIHAAVHGSEALVWQ